MIKKILLSVAGVVAVMALTIGILYAVQQFSRNDDSTLVPNLSKDYAACTSTESGTIKTALGEPALNLQAPQNLGIVEEEQVGEGAEDVIADSQVCVYAFTAGGSLENSFNADNAFILDKTRYTSADGAAFVSQQIAQDPSATSVTSLSDTAYFIATTNVDGPDAVSVFDLQVFSEDEQTSYSIRQPGDATTFTAETAQAALLSIAQDANN